MSQKSLRGTHFEAAATRFEFPWRIPFLTFSVIFACEKPEFDLLFLRTLIRRSSPVKIQNCSCRRIDLLAKGFGCRRNPVFDLFGDLRL